MVQLITLISSSAAILAGVALAQEPTASFNTSVVSGIAGELDAGTKAAWCNAQYRACNVLCNTQASENTCTSDTLVYQCTCAANSSAPALQYYNPTMISNVCNRYLGDCLAATAGRADQQQNCKNTIVCGNSSVDAYANSTAGRAPASSAGSTPSSSATASATSSTATPSRAAAAALQIAQGYATPIFGAILLGAFGIAL